MEKGFAKGRRSHSFDKFKIDQQLEEFDQYFGVLNDDTLSDQKPRVGTAIAYGDPNAGINSSLEDFDLYVEGANISDSLHRSRRYSGVLEKLLSKQGRLEPPNTSASPKSQSSDSRNSDIPRHSCVEDMRSMEKNSEQHNPGNDGGLSYSPKRRAKSSSALGRHRTNERIARQSSTQGDIKEAHTKSGTRNVSIVNEDRVSGKECSKSVRTWRKSHHSPRRLSPQRNKERCSLRTKITPYDTLEAGFGVAQSLNMSGVRNGEIVKESTFEEGAIPENPGNLAGITKPTYHRSQSARPNRNLSSHSRRDVSSARRADGHGSRQQDHRPSKRVSASLSPVPSGSRRIHHSDDGNMARKEC